MAPAPAPEEKIKWLRPNHAAPGAPTPATQPWFKHEAYVQAATSIESTFWLVRTYRFESHLQPLFSHTRADKSL